MKKSTSNDGILQCTLWMGTYNSGMPRTTEQDAKLRFAIVKPLVEEEIEVCREADALNEQYLRETDNKKAEMLAKKVGELVAEIDYIEDEIQIKQRVILR